ncbi:MAG: radical SAM protein [Deltaproteobacteria bacterium]|nr:radical SAM protein [Candidatus Zymogenaceae bacterium]
MKVLIISANRELVPDPVFPLGAAYVAAAVRDAGHQVKILDALVHDNPEAAVKQAVSDFSPDVVGVSIRNVDNVAYPIVITYADDHKGLVDAARSVFSGPVVLGGSGFTILAEELLDHTGAELGIMGEGEEAMLTFLDAYADGEDIAGVPGLIHRKDGTTLVKNPPRTIGDIESVSNPAREMLDSRMYQKWGGMVGVQTKRGCPLGCVYCTYPVVEGKVVRTRDPEAVAREMAESYHLWGTDTFFIVDNVFNNPPDHAVAVAGAIEALDLPLSFSAYLNPGFVTGELMSAMKAAGCTGIDYGVDSLSDDVLKRLGKNFTAADVRRAVRLTKEAGIRTCLSMIFGAPGETMDSLRDGVHILEEMEPTAVLALVGVRVYPNTKMYDIARKARVLPDDWNGLTPFFYIDPAVADDVIGFIAETALRHPDWLFPGHMIMGGRQLMPEEKPERYDSGPLAEFRKRGVKGNLWEMFDIMKAMKSRQ